jgi:hypothetical protein
VVHVGFVEDFSTQSEKPQKTLPHSNNDYTPPRRGRVNLVFVHGVSGQLLSPVVSRFKLSIAMRATVGTSYDRFPREETY